MKSLVKCLFVGVLLFAAPARADVYEDKVREFLKVSGADVQINQLLPGMLQQIRPMMRDSMVMEMERAGQSMSDAELDAFLVRFEQEFVKEFDGIYDFVVPEYRKHLTLAEVEGIIAMLKQPAFKTYLQKMPALTAALQQAGTKWGEAAGQRAAQRALAK